MATQDTWPNNFQGGGGPGNPDPEPENYSPKWVDYNDWRNGGLRLYRSMLRRTMRDQVSPETAYRNQAYQSIATSQKEAARLAKTGATEAFGGLGQTSPLARSLQSQTALSAPYAQAGLTAREMGRDQALQAGQALAGTKQMQANWYNTMVGPIFQQYALDNQAQSIENAAELGLAGLAGGGGGFNWGAMLGSAAGTFGGSFI